MTDLSLKHFFSNNQLLNPRNLFSWLLAVLCVWVCKAPSWEGDPWNLFPWQISVLTVADAVRTCSLDQCYKTFLSPATSETKRKMSTFVSSIKASDSSTQHALGFQKAFQLLRNTNNGTRLQGSKAAPACASLVLKLGLANVFFLHVLTLAEAKGVQCVEY